ncbi:hypothetical protein CSOJ01_08362 [Colletotrichum sojae]|uniref:EKC/KEOPS complex subunit BUD32 n=1 Tax=Colletotrichum sojae TaxID=2175907 RepID=A0A8H6J622_9PEZI|nr:hypothetical protein CSOJ01_08362 [Colletotrichum sojae]
MADPLIPTLWTPFFGLHSLDRGAGGQVFAINDRIVFKCPTNFSYPHPQQAEEAIESAQRITHEKAVYEVLERHPHTNIIRCLLSIPEGFFMERMAMTLRDRIDYRPELNPPNAPTQLRWIYQIASAVAWLEKLGLVHGDLRPANILLTVDEHVRLADFDVCVKIGEELQAASEPFCKLDARLDTPPAGAVSEQFALASVIYTIRFNHIPMAELDAPERVQRIARIEMPPSEEDELFGDLIQDCWQGRYPSMAAMYEEIRSRVCRELGPEDGVVGESHHETPDLVAQCEEFVVQGRARANPSPLRRPECNAVS